MMKPVSLWGPALLYLEGLKGLVPGARGLDGLAGAVVLEEELAALRLARGARREG
jgi:hypothetical protein